MALLVPIIGALVRLHCLRPFDLRGVELRKEPRDGSFAFLSRGVEANYFILEVAEDYFFLSVVLCCLCIL